jgi:hypothetical protein
MGMMKEALKPTLVQKHALMQRYTTLPRPGLCYGSEVWTVSKETAIDVQSAKWSLWEEQMVIRSGIIKEVRTL